MSDHYSTLISHLLCNLTSSKKVSKLSRFSVKNVARQWCQDSPTRVENNEGQYLNKSVKIESTKASWVDQPGQLEENEGSA